MHTFCSKAIQQILLNACSFRRFLQRNSEKKQATKALSVCVVFTHCFRHFDFQLDRWLLRTYDQTMNLAATKKSTITTCR